MFDDLSNSLFGIKAKHDPKYPVVNIGDKIEITNWEMFSPNEVAKFCKLPHLIVDDVVRITIGQNGDYTYRYDVYIENHNNPVGIDNYKLI